MSTESNHQQPVNFEYGVPFEVKPDLSLESGRGNEGVYVEPVPLINDGQMRGSLRIIKTNYEEMCGRFHIEFPLGPLPNGTFGLDIIIELIGLDLAAAEKHRVQMILNGDNERIAKPALIDYELGTDPSERTDIDYLDWQEPTSKVETSPFFPNNDATFDQIKFVISKESQV